jgi:hypothetical protein
MKKQPSSIAVQAGATSNVYSVTDGERRKPYTPSQISFFGFFFQYLSLSSNHCNCHHHMTYSIAYLNLNMTNNISEQQQQQKSFSIFVCAPFLCAST